MISIINKSLLEKEYLLNMKGSGEIARELGVKRWVVTNAIAKYRIPTRNQSQSKIKFPIIGNKKMCSKCLKLKLLSEFTKSTKTKSGKASACKKCLNVKTKLWTRLAIQRERTKILKELGFSCAHCGENDFRCLQIDHCFGGGTAERNAINSVLKYYKTIFNKIRNGSKEYQVLCANCNWRKKYDFNEGYSDGLITAIV